jgi:serine/threonine protein kinase
MWGKVSHRKGMEERLAGGYNCRNCGAIVTADQRFCANCGLSIGAQQLKEEHYDTTPLFRQASLLEEENTNVRGVIGSTVAGNLLGNRYRVVRLVDKGSFGIIYEALDTRFQAKRTVAIKEMSDAHLNATDKAQFVTSVRQEANLLAQLKHANLPGVIDFFAERGNVYLVMEFIRGTTLEKQLEMAGGPLNERLVMEWTLQLCDVLNYLHSRPQPIIFRDLKPSNIMINEEGKIKLIDFGIARIFKTEASHDTVTLGSRNFAAPEQYGLGQSDPRTDIYALGATLYALLTGTAPIDALLRQANLGLFRGPRELNPKLSIIAEQIVLKAMSLEPKNRFQSVIDMFYTIGSSGLVPFTSGDTLPSVNMSQRFSDPQMQALSSFSATLHQPSQTPTLLTPASAISGEMIFPNVVDHPITDPSGPPPSAPSQAPDSGRMSRRHLLIGGIGAATAIALGGTAVGYFLSNKGSNTITRIAAGNSIAIPFTCSTEKQTWMQASVNAFHKTGASVGGKTIQIDLDLRGSLDGQQKILNGTIQPIIWSPASFLELNQLSSAWQQGHAGKDVIINSGTLQAKSLVSSPLVFAFWRDRAEAFLRHYPSVDWPSIHDALKQTSWANIGGLSVWGPVKFGHTRPDQSNSGLLTITLLAYAFYNEERGLTVPKIDNPQFLSYFNDIEGAVSAFGRSSGTFYQNVVIPLGAPEFDIIATYENLVLTGEKLAITTQQEPLRLFYPSLNIVSDHPFAILQGSWVTPEQQMAAQKFRDFLLSPEQQRLALTTGFRPSTPGIQITDNVPGNVFLQQSSYNISPKVEITPLANVPTTAVINELIKQWKAYYDGSPTTLG